MSSLFRMIILNGLQVFTVHTLYVWFAPAGAPVLHGWQVLGLLSLASAIIGARGIYAAVDRGIDEYRNGIKTDPHRAWIHWAMAIFVQLLCLGYGAIAHWMSR
jgi:alpha-D-ribose 1-methylphosphonate 5-phosphate C-P lyase